MVKIGGQRIVCKKQQPLTIHLQHRPVKKEFLERKEWTSIRR